MAMRRRPTFPFNRPPPHGRASAYAWKPSAPRKHNFTIDLRLSSRPNNHLSMFRSQIDSIVEKCNPSPESVTRGLSDCVIATISYDQWTHARDAVLCLWKSRLAGDHSFSPELHSPLLLPSDKEELDGSLKTLFLDRIDDLLRGEKLGNWEVKLNRVLDEIARLKRRKFRTLISVEEERGLQAERELIAKRIREFKAALNCIRAHLEGSYVEQEDGLVPVFKFESKAFDWNRIHHLLLRECKRLDDGLPIYAYRRDILSRIYVDQVIVLIGETGSGKSTQLAQFIVDAGLSNDAIVCTQPRKIAASTLAERVKEESSGCYEDDSIICQPSFSSSQSFSRSKVIYMTDHCLLQHYMHDKNLNGISCIIIDEAHERSLNTDLLLAMIRDLLGHRPYLRLVIMSATADAKQLSDYYFGCDIMRVTGRNFPVDIKYENYACGEGSPGIIPQYVSEAVRVAKKLHKDDTERIRDKESKGKGTILVFLTSQMEVEWACENFVAPFAVALPLHGKLSNGEQSRVFQEFTNERKVIFATNLAETSLTIPGVKYVIDSGKVKESCFDPKTGINVLRVCNISKSSALQRAGRAGRTEPGVCYRLYDHSDFEKMPDCLEPEIRRVHIGIAVLKILALGIKTVQDFNFVDAPSDQAIDMAVRNLVQLGAVSLKNGVYELTGAGRYLVKLGVEPRLGKLIYSCYNHGYGKEGLVLAAVMANASSVFCRVGTLTDKLKSDSLKVRFCHHSGDLFTLLSVYKEWESTHWDKRNTWCWENSINAKSMRRCNETVKELHDCLKRELGIVIPNTWTWDPFKTSVVDHSLKKIILSCLSENVAVFSGHEKLGYKVALTGKHVQLHPSCSLLAFNQKPSWVVFGEILSLSHSYLACVTTFDFESLSALSPPPLFDPLLMESQMLHFRVITGCGNTILRKFCGKKNSNLEQLEKRFQEKFSDERIRILMDVSLNEVSLAAPSQAIDEIFTVVNDLLECEKKWLQNECESMPLYKGPASSTVPIALLGAGAEIKHLELQRRDLSINICHQNANAIDDKELLSFIEKTACGSICAVQKFHGDTNDKEKWGKITFLTPDAAQRALQTDQIEFCGGRLKFLPSQTSSGDFTFPAVRAKLSFPRRLSKGVAIVTTDVLETDTLLDQLSNLVIGGKNVRSQIGNRGPGAVIVFGIPKEAQEQEVLNAIRNATDRRLHMLTLLKGEPPETNPSASECEEAITREISAHMPKGNHNTHQFQVEVFPPHPRDAWTRATISFDGNLHLEAAKALDHIVGKVLPGCQPWQKIQCGHMFQSTIFCPARVYHVIKDQLNAVLSRPNYARGTLYSEFTRNGGFRVKIFANATRRVAELRRPLENLMRGRLVDDPRLTPSVLQNLFVKDSEFLKIEEQTRTRIDFNRHNQVLRIYGPLDKVQIAEQRLIRTLLTLHERKQLEINLRRKGFSDAKEVMELFGPGLNVLKEKVPEAEFTLDIRRHVIRVSGDKDAKQRAEDLISDMTKELVSEPVSGCPVCFCPVEDGYSLEDCGHRFCRSCLVEQCESAIKNHDILPLKCAHDGCGAHILMVDLRALLLPERLNELFWAGIGKFVASSGGKLRFCPSPDCPSVYDVSGPDPFVCGSCFAETCTRCHLEYHPDVSCERYKVFKDDPDSSLEEWRKGKTEVKKCGFCGFVIEKIEGCNHIECRCGKHLCWNCLEGFETSDLCYEHLRSIHFAII